MILREKGVSAVMDMVASACECHIPWSEKDLGKLPGWQVGWMGNVLELRDL